MNDDEIMEKFGKAFFIEMLAYGIALKKDSYDISFLLEDIVNKTCVDLDFDAETDKNRVRFYTSAGIPVIGLIYENGRILFTMPGEKPDLTMAELVTSVLFSVASVCLEQQVLEIRETEKQKNTPIPIEIEEKQEDNFECDDDFLI